LEGKIGYTNVVWSLLPDKFTLTELREVYEALLGKKLDKRNFNRKIIFLGLLKKSGEPARRGAHRPAKLYRFKNKKYKVVEVI
jgi:8-oxo-dGTP diphosphatase